MYIKAFMKMIIDRKKFCLTGILLFLLVLLYILIFSFSDQDSETSGNLSLTISQKCVELVEVVIRKQWTYTFKQELAAYFEHPIRKLAHFCEYACMGILVYSILAQWMACGKRRSWLTIVWVFVSAAADEFHQLFVPGRYGSFADVLLDTCGCFFGIVLVRFMIRILKCNRNKFHCNFRKRRKAENNQSCME